MDPDTENTAAVIKRHFYEFKRAQLGKSYSPAERFRRPEIWTAAAEKCAKLKADPYHFVRAAFRFNNVPGGPFPTGLAGCAIEHWYGTLMREVGAATGGDPIEAEIRLLMVGLIRQANAQTKLRFRDYLLDGPNAGVDVFPAFIRMMLLPKDLEIQKRWARTATNEISANPKLLETLQRMGVDLAYTEVTCD